MDASLSSFWVFALGNLRGANADRTRPEVLAQLTQLLRHPDFDPNLQDERGQGVLEALAKPWPGVVYQEEYPWMRGALTEFALLGAPAGEGVLRPQERLVGEWLARGGHPFPPDRPWAGVLAHLERPHVSVVRTLLEDPRRPPWPSAGEEAARAWEAVLRLDSVPLATALVASGCPAPTREVQGLPQWSQAKSAEVFAVLVSAYPEIVRAPVASTVLSSWAARQGKGDAALCGLLRARLNPAPDLGRPVDLTPAFEATPHRTWARLAPLVQDVSDLCAIRQPVPELPGETETLVEKIIRESLEGVELDGSLYSRTEATLKRPPAAVLGHLLAHPGVNPASKALIGVFLETWREWMEEELRFLVEPAFIKTLKRLDGRAAAAYGAQPHAAWEAWGRVLTRASARVAQRAEGQSWDDGIQRLQRYVKGVSKAVQRAALFQGASKMAWRASIPLAAAAHENDSRMPGVWEERLEAWNAFDTNKKAPLELEDAVRLWWLLRSAKALEKNQATLVARVEAALLEGLAHADTYAVAAWTIHAASGLRRPCPESLEAVQVRLEHAVLAQGLPFTPSTSARPRL